METNDGMGWPLGRQVLKGIISLSIQRVINFKFLLQRTSNTTSHSLKNLAFHSFLRWKMIIPPILTTSVREGTLFWGWGGWGVGGGLGLQRGGSSMKFLWKSGEVSNVRTIDLRVRDSRCTSDSLPWFYVSCRIAHKNSTCLPSNAKVATGSSCNHCRADI